MTEEEFYFEYKDTMKNDRVWFKSEDRERVFEYRWWWMSRMHDPELKKFNWFLQCDDIDAIMIEFWSYDTKGSIDLARKSGEDLGLTLTIWEKKHGD